MPFKQGSKPVTTIEKDERKAFRGDLFACGYKPHTGPRTRRNGEIQAWVKPIGRGRQVHVQEELADDGSIKVFAHTEPSGYGLDHLVAAVLDEASFSGGSKVLRSDLKKRGRKV